MPFQYYYNDQEVKPDPQGDKFQRYAALVNEILSQLNGTREKRNLLVKEFVRSIQQDKELAKYYPSISNTFSFFSKEGFINDDMAKRFIAGLCLDGKTLAFDESKRKFTP